MDEIVHTLLYADVIIYPCPMNDAGLANIYFKQNPGGNQ